MMGNVESSWHKLKNKLKLLLWMNYWSDEKEKDQIRDILCCVLQEKYTFVVFWVTERRRRVNEFFPRIIACKQKRQRQNLSMQLWMLMWFLKDKHKAIRLATHHLQITKHQKQHCSEELMHGLFAYLKKKLTMLKMQLQSWQEPKKSKQITPVPGPLHCLSNMNQICLSDRSQQGLWDHPAAHNTVKRKQFVFLCLSGTAKHPVKLQGQL